VSLSARQQRTLDLIAEQIAGSDPELARSLAAFDRNPGRPGRTSQLARYLVVIWAVLAVALITVALLLSHSSHGGAEAHARCPAVSLASRCIR
jgi:hypothetical protein